VFRHAPPGPARDASPNRRAASPIDPVAAFVEAERLRKTGAAADAARLYAAVLRRQPRHQKALAGRAAALAALGRADEAAALRRRARKVEAEDLCTIGHAAMFHGRGNAALACYRRSVALDPTLAEAVWGMAEALRGRGRRAAAARWYRRLLDLNPDNAEARHMLAALGAGETPPRASDAYVVGYFDRFADYFDRQLADHLDYRVPTLIAAAIGGARPKLPPAAAVLDLGCGTGLAGAALGPLAGRLDGVDLSPAMLAKARARGIYDRLRVAEVSAHLGATGRRYDLAICADALVYVGELAPVMAGVARVLRPAGLFACSTEWRRGADVVLTATGRYAHGRPAVREAAAAAGLVEESARNAILRTESGHPVTGTIWLFRRP